MQSRQRAHRAPAALERVAAYVATDGEDSSQPGAESGCVGRRPAGRERLLIDHRRAWAERWERADVRDRGRPRAAARRAPGALSPDELGSRQRRGGRRRARPIRSRLPRPRLLGQRRVRAAVPRGHAPQRLRERSSSTASGACPRPGLPRAPPGAEGARFAWESAASGGGRDAALRCATGPGVGSRSTRASARSTSSPTSRGPPAATSTGPAMRRSAMGPAGSCSSKRPATGPRGSSATPTGAPTFAA